MQSFVCPFLFDIIAVSNDYIFLTENEMFCFVLFCFGFFVSFFLLFVKVGGGGGGRGWGAGGVGGCGGGGGEGGGPCG